MKKVAGLFVLLSVCLFEDVVQRYGGMAREIEMLLLQQIHYVLVISLTVWLGALLYLTFNGARCWLIVLCLLLIGSRFCLQNDTDMTDTLFLLYCATLGLATCFFLKERTNIESFLVCLVVSLALSSWWHLDVSKNFYHGPRWMGLWDNPNTYGMLMSAGVTLAAGLLAATTAERRVENEEVLTRAEDGKRKAESFLRLPLRNLPSAILVVAAFIMTIGLVFSYSRGAWLGTAIGLLYLAKAYGRLRWKLVLPGIFTVAAAAWMFWNETPDLAPWYIKRMDLGRPSAQHRAAAWKAGLEIMRDHPFGVGWNKTVVTYQNSYLPPTDGAAAIMTNDYLMLGTQLGLPGLACFVVYVGLGFKRSVDKGLMRSIRDACRAGALALLAEFWFDGGLFKLPTASVFWILLELGREDGRSKPRPSPVVCAAPS